MHSPGIWAFAHLFGDDGQPAALAAESRWTLGEGDTPTEEWPSLASELGLDRLLLKREDLNPGGSHKDRGLLYQVAAHRSHGPVRGFVLSSSGNAAVSAAAACRASGDRLLTFVSPHTAPAKYRKLVDSGVLVVVSAKPINYARYAGRVFGLTDLRGSQDPAASIGYRSIAGELAPVAPDAVLTFSSSGTSMRGILEGFGAAGRAVACTAVQAGVCLGIARALHPTLPDEPGNPAGRLGIRNPPDADRLAHALQASGGGAVAVRADAVHAMARRLLHRPEGPLQVSPEGAAVLAAIVDGAARGALRGTVVAIITGRGDQWHDDDREAAQPADDPSVVHVTSYLELRDALLARGFEAA